VFSLCAIGLHYATGCHPFAGRGAQHEMLSMMLGKRQPLPSSPLNSLLERGIAARAEQRIPLAILLAELARLPAA
jgi:hypothetical protein